MEKTICEECGGEIIQKKVSYSVYDIKVGDFEAEVCKKCGEVCFSEEESKKITSKTKEMGAFKKLAKEIEAKLKKEKITSKTVSEAVKWARRASS